jgi:hypothetical protein
MLKDDPNCSSSGCTQYLWPKHKGADPHPVDYFVPNFGANDREIRDVYSSLEAAEAIRGSHWHYVADNSKPAGPVLYNYEPELDDDIVSTQEHEVLASKAPFNINIKRVVAKDKKDAAKQKAGLAAEAAKKETAKAAVASTPDGAKTADPASAVAAAPAK